MTTLSDACSKRILIIGGGPAGLSAGLWLRNLGLLPTIAEKAEVLGGALRLNFLQNNWVLGQEDMTGVQLASKFADHASHAGLDYRLGCFPDRIRRNDSGWRVDLAGCDSGVLDCSGIVIATGTRFRGGEIVAGIPGARALPPELVAFGPHAFADMERCRESHVAIVGGGDNAFENARFLLALGARVTLLARSAPRAQAELRAAVENHPAFRMLQPAALAECSTGARGMLLKAKVEDEFLSLAADRLHVLAGYTPNTAFLNDLFTPDSALRPLLDDAGHIVVDASGRTSTPGLYAAGDVCNRNFPSVVSALSDGARVAKMIEADLRR